MMKRIMNYNMEKARNIPSSLKFKRVGIIPYFVYDNKNHFFLMKDSKYEELTDCGGIPKRNETWLSTAIRETEEESRGFFRFTNKFVLNNGHVMWREDFRIAVVFVNITRWMNCLVKAANFCNRYKLDYDKGMNERDNAERLENSEMLIHDEDTLKELCFDKEHNKIYTPVRCLLQKFFNKRYPNEIIV